LSDKEGAARLFPKLSRLLAKALLWEKEKGLFPFVPEEEVMGV
jgi:hypothetical protein